MSDDSISCSIGDSSYLKFRKQQRDQVLAEKKVTVDQATQTITRVPKKPEFTKFQDGYIFARKRSLTPDSGINSDNEDDVIQVTNNQINNE